ncbi:D-aminoacyl-tRNA deacylase [Tengunoibacter tsumagoiensis]|uniref:D-aminoacyl-tRNA deacylase n=1 Tax=Tengunoibacter tsumagoiensis TaxID=2014871 RepID=A0A401ZW85_9CHLR|nr:D-aminoacyl-tRNA deacylase [Tengunoibacter tsumagoiensis]GCE11117.1 D-aminoacyl-tRNA deacylase [Tengunoibacter tsumagoiensis]
MRALLQRVSSARVTVDEQVVGQIGPGLLVFLGVSHEDGAEQVQQLVAKIVHLRIFEDTEGKMNRSLLDLNGELLAVSQFTLYANMRRGRRPSFTEAAPPSLAEPLFELFKQLTAGYGLSVASGIFGATMQIDLCNEGPVTIWLDTDDLS